MNCPVCASSGISDDQKLCPECQSDLEAFQLTRSVEKSSKWRLNYGVLFTILFLIAIVLWFFKGTSGNAEAQEQEQGSQTEFNTTKMALEKANSENSNLKKENEQLTARLATFAEQSKKREKIYMVQEGESLYSIARKVYGNGYKYVDLAKDNKIENPDQLIIGQKLVIYY